jgi:hypothetical protein
VARVVKLEQLGVAQRPRDVAHFTGTDFPATLGEEPIAFGEESLK